MLIQQLADIAGQIMIAPLVEDSDLPTGLGGIEDEPSSRWSRITGWEITYVTVEGTFTVTGKTIAEAVDAALANPDAW